MYGLFGQNIPGEFGHPSTPLMSFLGTMTISEGGIWGSLTGVSVSIVAVFVIFGAVLNAGQAGVGFMNVASYFAGRLRGGANARAVARPRLRGSRARPSRARRRGARRRQGARHACAAARRRASELRLAIIVALVKLSVRRPNRAARRKIKGPKPRWRSISS